jgi:[acyl-carrier-protein] S-malonyltransferase
MTGTAILCSGQGAQAAGMFDLLADAPEAAAVFEAAKAVLDGRDPRDLVRQAGEDELHADKAGQVLCCTQAMAAWAVLGDLVPHPLVVAGYSVGELAAWGVARVLDAKTVLGPRRGARVADGRRHEGARGPARGPRPVQAHAGTALPRA